jgi:hypothetical protein
MPRWLLGIPGNEPIPASEEVGRAHDSAELRTWTYPHEPTIVRDDGRVFVWNAASVAVDDGTEDSLAVAINNGGVGRYEFVPGWLLAHLDDATTVPVHGVDTTQSSANGKIAVNALGQKFPRRPPLFDLVDGLPNECSGLAAQVLADATGVFLLRQEDRYIDGGTGQVRSRAWNDSAQYLILGETGDACPQLYFNGLRGVKTAASATSCIRIPNAYIDPDAAFSITVLMAVRPSATTPSNRPAMLIGSQHGDMTAGRVTLRQNAGVVGYSMYNASAIGWGMAAFAPYAFTISAKVATAAFYRDGSAPLGNTAKIAGTIYADDHAIGGYWDEAGGVWHSYEGFYVLAVLIHSRELTASEIGELHAALVRPEVQKLCVHVGQSNTGSASLAGASPVPLPNYAHAMCDTYLAFPNRGWGPVDVQPYAGVTAQIGQQVSPTQGFASALPIGHAHVKVSLGGQGLPSFYDDGALCIKLQESMMRAIFQLGCRVSMKYLVIVSCESEADVATPSATVTSRLNSLREVYGLGFEKGVADHKVPRVVVSILNSQYKLGIPGAALVRAGEIAFVAADGNARAFDSNAVPLDFGDNVHWLGASRILVGVGLGTAALT